MTFVRTFTFRLTSCYARSLTSSSFGAYLIFLAYLLTVSISNLLTFPTYLQLGHFADRGEGF